MSGTKINTLNYCIQMSQGEKRMLYYGSYTEEHLMFSFRAPRKLKQDLKVMFKKYKTEQHSHWDQHRRAGHNSMPVQIHVWSFLQIFFPPFKSHQHLRSVTFLRLSLPSVTHRACAPKWRMRINRSSSASAISHDHSRLLCHGGRKAVLVNAVKTHTHDALTFLSY